MTQEQEVKGFWAAFLKVHMTVVTAIIPLVLAWAVWITKEQFSDREFRESGERFTQSDGRRLEDKLNDSIGPKIDRVDMRVQQIERESTRILTKLEQIEQAVNRN